MKHPNADKPGGIVAEAARMNEQKQVEKNVDALLLFEGAQIVDVEYLR